LQSWRACWGIDQSVKQVQQGQMENHTPKALAALAFTILVWGVTPVFVRAFSLATGPFEALLIRTAAVAIVFAIALFLTSGFAIERKDWLRLALVSLIGLMGYFVFSIFGFFHAPAGIGTLIMATQPMLIAILAWQAGQEKISNLTIIGLLVSFAGSALLVWGDDTSTATSTAEQVVIGCLLIFFASVGWAIFVVHARPLIQKYGAIKITGISNILIALPLLPFFSGTTWSTIAGLQQDAMVSLAFLTFLGATLSVVTWNFAAGVLKPSLLGAGLYIMPVIAVFAGWAMLSEPITMNIIIAAALILAGVAISNYKPIGRSS
jgi:drug/metabolite transporter (DMT)-like permease